MKVIVPASQGILAYPISRKTGIQLGYAELEKLPDGEKYVRIPENVEGKEIYIVNSFAHIPDELIIETLFLVDTFKELGAKKVIGIFPYFPYSRLMRRFIRGEAAKLKSVAKLFKVAGLDKMYVVDFHQRNFDEIFDFEVVDITAMHLLAEYAKENFILESPFVVGADEVAEYWAKIVAEELNAEYSLMRKIRIDAENVIVDSVPDEVVGKDVMIVDDIISTGGTVVQAVKALKAAGARRIYAACTHPALSNAALKMICHAGIDGIVGTDTVLSPISHVSVAGLISDSIMRS
ncbi:ribose-phosphate pyrophosphokinase [Archaeoglobales archaeon]|nr:MAG: ribose-phosphate pyrophosphokinase [Archaeoglobales archaeon]